MVLGLWADVLFHEVEVTVVQVEEEVPVRSQQGAMFTEDHLEVLEGLIKVVDPWVLVEKLPNKGGAGTSDAQEQDVRSGGCQPVTEASPPGVLEKMVSLEYFKSELVLFREHQFYGQM